MSGGGGRILRENIEWCDIWIAKAAEKDAARALFIGDSITRAYYPFTAKVLAGKFACARLATSKCVGDPGLPRELGLVLDEYRYEVIHFNNGMHGWDYTEAEYAAGLGSFMDTLVSKSSGARLIWASTTPVRNNEDLRELDEAMTARVRERNRLALDLASQRGFEVNDLFSLVTGHPEYSQDGVHFNEAGCKAMGERVAAVVSAGR